MPGSRKDKGKLSIAGLTSVTAGTLVMLVWAIFSTPALATHVEPVLQPSNPPCPAGTTELKVEPVAAGQYTDGTLTVNITLVTLANGPGFNWTSNIGVDAVIAKGGPDGNVYTYNPEATSDTNLHAPLGAGPGGSQFFGLSHISFCYDEDDTPDLGITKSASSTQVNEGGAFSYTITVQNTGDASATNVVVTDDLDNNLTGVSVSASQGTCDPVGAGNTIECDLGTLAAGGSATVTINATAPQLPLTQGGACEISIANTASVDSDQTAPETSNTVTVTVTGTGCATTTTATTQPPPTTTPTTPTPTTVAPTPTTVAPTTVTPPPPDVDTTPPETSVQPTTVTPSGTAFTGPENVIPLGVIALTLMTTGSGLLWAGSRLSRREDDDS